MENVYTSGPKTLRFKSFPAPEISLSDIISGDISIWQHGLQQLGLLQQYKDIVLDSISDISSAEIRNLISQEGFEHLHQHLSIPQLQQLDRLLIKRFSPCARSFFTIFLDVTQTAHEATYYFAGQAWARIIAPEDRLTPYMPLIRDELGHLVAHNPHRDSWFSQASNVINFWIALGRVQPGNSVLIYPESYAEELQTEDMKLSREQRLSPPLNFDMNEGDILLFHGDHLHSSELNITGQTRLVLSFRLTYGPPEYGHDDNQFRYKLL